MFWDLITHPGVGGASYVDPDEVEQALYNMERIRMGKNVQW